MTWEPGTGHQSTDYISSGTTITASGTTHTKGSWSQIIASTSSDYYGLFIEISDMAVSATDTSGLLDIGVGAASSEVVIIPDLAAGFSSSGGTSGGTMGHWYFFPLWVPSGSRLSARLQAAVASDTCIVRMWGIYAPRHVPGFVGQKVTAYGVSAANSSGVVVTPSASADTFGSYATIDSSTSDPIRYLQVGIQGGRSNNTNGFHMAQIAKNGSQLLVDRIWANLSASEVAGFGEENLALAQQEFDIPAGSNLQARCMTTSTGAWPIDLIIYGMS